jgi:hypothetical protein
MLHDSKIRHSFFIGGVCGGIGGSGSIESWPVPDMLPSIRDNLAFLYYRKKLKFIFLDHHFHVVKEKV